AGRWEQRVAVTQGNVGGVGGGENHPGARSGPAGLDEAEVPRRDRGSQGELELAEVPSLPPLAKQRPRRRCTLGEGHARTLTATPLLGDRPARVIAALPDR